VQGSFLSTFEAGFFDMPPFNRDHIWSENLHVVATKGKRQSHEASERLRRKLFQNFER